MWYNFEVSCLKCALLNANESWNIWSIIYQCGMIIEIQAKLSVFCDWIEVLFFGISRDNEHLFTSSALFLSLVYLVVMFWIASDSVTDGNTSKYFCSLCMGHDELLNI